MSKKFDEQLAAVFRCPRCKEQGAVVERLSMTGSGLTRLLDIQPYKYMFVSCQSCGYTEVYNSKILEGKQDQGMDILDILFSLD